MRTLQFNKAHNVVNATRLPVVGERFNAFVINDGKKRFDVGEFITTSPVLSVSGNRDLGYVTVTTVNTTYVAITDDLYGKGQLVIEIAG